MMSGDECETGWDSPEEKLFQTPQTENWWKLLLIYNSRARVEQELPPIFEDGGVEQ